MSDLDRLAAEDFVRLTSFKRDGTPVPTTVWVARDGETLVVTTMRSTGKAKRIRNDGRVTLVPSGRDGDVDPTAASVEGQAVVFDDDEGLGRLSDLLVSKYGVQARALFGIRKLMRKDQDRIGLRITLPG